MRQFMQLRVLETEDDNIWTAIASQMNVSTNFQIISWKTKTKQNIWCLSKCPRVIENTKGNTKIW